MSSSVSRVRLARRSWVAAIAAIAVGLGLMTGVSAPAAQAYDGSNFDTGYIISDSQFYSRDAMTQPEIQAFLEMKVGNCLNANCLAIKRTDTFTRAQDRTVCNQYTGAAGELTSTIIFKVQQACGISARVLLVTLQKENSLITAKAPSDGSIRTAMGYGCPDTAPCDAQYFGLYNQLYKAAWQLKRYSTPDQWGSIQPGLNYIWYHPNTRYGTCSGQYVTVMNNATAALYNYTPYVPNLAALLNLGTTGDACSSYGNRNFWDYYYSWFGNPTGVSPTGVTTSRIQGADRYSTAAKIAQTVSPSTTGTVYIANGEAFPDALSAAPAVTLQNGPLLLVTPTSIPESVVAELTRLKPQKIVIVGLESAVSAEVEAQLAAYATVEVRRDGGADRYETSRLIAERAFPAGSTTTAYLATGNGFADALTASAAAGSRNAPVILVNGLDPTIDAETLATLSRLGVTNVLIAGSSGAVSDGIASSVDAAPGISVTRLGGKDRFATASAINRNAFSTSATIYMSVFSNFPDALAGAVLAGSTDSALLLSPSTCMFRQTAQDVIDLKAKKLVLLGGTSALGGGVSTFLNCD